MSDQEKENMPDAAQLYSYHGMPEKDVLYQYCRQECSDPAHGRGTVFTIHLPV